MLPHTEEHSLLERKLCTQMLGKVGIAYLLIRESGNSVSADVMKLVEFVFMHWGGLETQHNFFPSYSVKVIQLLRKRVLNVWLIANAKQKCYMKIKCVFISEYLLSYLM